MHHVAERHGNMTLVRNVIFESFRCSLWFEFFAFRGLRLHDHSFNMQNAIFSFQFETSHLRKVLQLEPFGLASLVTLQGIVEALVLSKFILALSTISS